MAKDGKTDSGRGQIQKLPQGEPVVDHPEEEEGGDKHQQHSGTWFCCNNLCSANARTAVLKELTPKSTKVCELNRLALDASKLVRGSSPLGPISNWQPNLL